MTERSICYFKTRGERRATKGDKRGRPSTEYTHSRYVHSQLICAVVHSQ